jgi:choline-sulfatase
VAALDGASLLPLASDHDAPWGHDVFAEYLAHGVTGPMAMLRRGRYKLNYSLGDDPELYDLAADPGEFANLANGPEHRPVVEELTGALLDRWDPVELDRVVRQSQRERLLIATATPTGDEDIGQALWHSAGALDNQSDNPGAARRTVGSGANGATSSRSGGL